MPIGFWSFFAGAVFAAASPAALSQAPDPQAATFHARTRLVEVEVVVRGKQGPITGLKKEDFTVLDQGKPQRIDVFRAGPADAETHAMPLPRGAVSNRVDNLGEALPSGTVLLFDQLNTRLDFKAYERKAVLQLARSLGPRKRCPKDSTTLLPLALDSMEFVRLQSRLNTSRAAISRSSMRSSTRLRPNTAKRAVPRGLRRSQSSSNICVILSLTATRSSRQ